jgi:hypothetical protein
MNTPTIKDSIQQELKIIQIQIDTLEKRWDTLDTQGTSYGEQVDIEEKLELLQQKRSELTALL